MDKFQPTIFVLTSLLEKNNTIAIVSKANPVIWADHRKNQITCKKRMEVLTQVFLFFSLVLHGHKMFLVFFIQQWLASSLDRSTKLKTAIFLKNKQVTKKILCSWSIKKFQVFGYLTDNVGLFFSTHGQNFRDTTWIVQGVFVFCFFPG